MKIINDYYEATKIIKEQYGVDIARVLIIPSIKDGPPSNNAHHCVRIGTMASRHPGDDICKIEFRFENEIGDIIAGMFVYRRNPSGIDILGGAAVMIPSNEKMNIIDQLT